MSSQSITAAGNANQGTARSCGTIRTGVRFTEAVMRKAQSLFQSKIPAEMSVRTRRGLRTAEHWHAGNREMRIEDYLALLQGREAVEFLEVFWQFVPEQARERWINQELLSRRIKAAEDKAQASKREIEALRVQLNKR